MEGYHKMYIGDDVVLEHGGREPDLTVKICTIVINSQPFGKPKLPSQAVLEWALGIQEEHFKRKDKP